MTLVVEQGLEAVAKSYDWEEAFSVACRDRIRNSTPWNKAVLTTPAAHTDVKRVIASVIGENDGARWVGLFELNDGRFVAISSWCDYTGWGCQDGGEMMVASSEEDIIRYGLSDGERERVGLPPIANTTMEVKQI